MYRRYLVILSLILLLCLPPLGIAYLYLYNAGELQDVDSIVAQQLQSPEFCIVGTALHQDLYHYKMALYRDYKPDVIALGSSRMLQYRGRYFNDRFLNMGSSLQDIPTGEHILETFRSVHKPRLILLGVDYWWFHAQIKQPGRINSPRQRKLVLDIGKLMQPYVWAYQGKLNAGSFVSRLVRGETAGECRVGVSANEEGSGFGPDGSYYYTGTVTGAKQDVYDRRFLDTSSEIRKGNSRLAHGQKVHPTHVEMFRDFIGSLRAEGIEVILFLPPHAPSIARQMTGMGDAYAYIDDLRDQLHKLGLAYHDFHDPTPLGASDCEFYDGSHAGDIVAARVLKALTIAGEASLSQSLDLGVIEAAVERHAGSAMLPEPRVTRLPEVDFLGLGCTKRH